MQASAMKFLRDSLAALVAEDGPLDACVVRLYQSNMDLPSKPTIDDFTEADFSGYAASSAIVWGTAYNDNDGTGVIVEGSNKHFAHNGGEVSNVIGGYYVTTTGGTPELKFAAQFPEPVELTEAGDGVTVVPTFELDGNQS